MQVKVNIESGILDWVLDNIDSDILSEQIINYLISWKKREKEPTFNQVEKVSRATGIPIGYFFLKTPPKEDTSFFNYRTVNSVELSNPSRNLIDTMHDMEQIQEWTKDHLISERAEKLEFVGSQAKQTNIINFAEYIRDLLGIKKDWYSEIKTSENAFNKIRTSISNLGVIVMMSGIVGNNTHRPLDIKEFRAFAIVDEYVPLIFINANDSMNGKMFSLLHEFTHICLGENSLFNDRFSTATYVNKTESICNAVAAEIMVPLDLFITEWGNAIAKYEIEKSIEILSGKFKCGQTVIARKAYDNGKIDYRIYHSIAQKAVEIYNDQVKRRKEKGSGGDFYRTAASRIDRRFFSLLLNSVQEGKTLYTDAFRLTNTNRSTFMSLAENVGGVLK